MGWLRSHLTCLAIYAFFAASVAPLDARRSLRANAECADADVLTAAQAQAVDALPPGASLLFGEVWGPSSMKKFGKTDVARAEFQAEVIGVQIGELGKVKQAKWDAAITPLKGQLPAAFTKQARVARESWSEPPVERLSEQLAIGSVAIECDDGDDERAYLPFVALTLPPKAKGGATGSGSGGDEGAAGSGTPPRPLPAGAQPGYVIIARTSNIWLSGTDATIGVVLQGDLGQTDTLVIDGKTGLERGETDTFSFPDAPAVGELRRVAIANDGGGFAAGWVFDWIRVKHVPTGREWALGKGEVGGGKVAAFDVSR